MSSQIYREMKQHVASKDDQRRFGYPQSGSGSRIPRTSGDPGVYALDCEMCTSRRNGENIKEIVKISIVNYRSEVVYNEIVRPRFTVTNYDTDIHGITQAQIRNGIDFSRVHSYIQQNFYSNTILVGHSLEHDLKALGLSHDLVVDVSLVYLRRNTGERISLKDLARMYLGKYIQDGSHDSVEDATVCMDLMMKKIGRL